MESVTGVHIDHFVVSNIEGFFQIAQQLGGINACIAPAPASIEPDGFKGGGNLVDEPYPGAPLKKSNSGFDAFKDGYNGKKAARSTFTCSQLRRWRSSAPGTRCPASTSAGPRGSRPRSTTSSTTSSTGTC